MVYKLSRGEIFIPESMGNNLESNPVKFHIQYLSVADRAELDQWVVPISGDKKNVRVRFDMKESFIRAVKKIENLTVEDDGEEKHITTAEEFVNLPFFKDMYTEVCLRIKETLGIQKKSS